MAEEEDPWAFDDSADTADTSAPTAAGGGDAPPPVAGDSGAPAADGAPAQEGGEQAADDSRPTVEDDQYRRPVQLYKHWVRPKFLQYKYMYNYRTNYYDDVLDYLDKRQIGVKREIPRPQTWAERVLRANSKLIMEEAAAEHERYAIKALALDSKILPFTYERSATQKSLTRSKSMLAPSKFQFVEAKSKG